MAQILKECDRLICIVDGPLYRINALTVLVEIRMGTVHSLDSSTQVAAESVFLAKVVGHAEVQIVRTIVPPTFLRNDLELMGNGAPGATPRRPTHGTVVAGVA